MNTVFPGRAEVDRRDRQRPSGDRPCGHCGLLRTNGVDPCIGRFFPNVTWSCCGHGVRSQASVCFFSDDGSLRTLKGEAALAFLGEPTT